MSSSPTGRSSTTGSSNSSPSPADPALRAVSPGARPADPALRAVSPGAHPADPATRAVSLRAPKNDRVPRDVASAPEKTSAARTAHVREPDDAADDGGEGAGRRDRVALVACGAIAQPAAEVSARRGWPVDVYPLNPLLHNAPQRIAGEVERLVGELGERYDRVVVGYADCGTYGALDEVCERLGIERLPGLHCYDLYAGADRLQASLDDEPGTYLLTDFLVKSFSRTVIQELGLDRWPELRDDYFGHYERIVWLQQTTDPVEQAELRESAQRAADRIGLPLQVLHTGLSGLEHALAGLVRASGHR